MTRQHVFLVPESFAKVAPTVPQAAAAAAGDKLMKALAAIVAGIDRLDAALTTARKEARRHLGYASEAYGALSSAVVDTAYGER